MAPKGVEGAIRKAKVCHFLVPFSQQSFRPWPLTLLLHGAFPHLFPNVSDLVPTNRAHTIPSAGPLEEPQRRRHPSPLKIATMPTMNPTDCPLPSDPSPCRWGTRRAPAVQETRFSTTCFGTIIFFPRCSSHALTVFFPKGTILAPISRVIIYSCPFSGRGPQVYRLF